MLNLDNLLHKELEQLEKSHAEPIDLGDNLFLDYRNDVIKPVTYYINSRYLNGQEDEFGELPFMNTVNANADVSKVATDFDTKDIRVESDDGNSYDMSLTFNKDIYDWMKRTNFAKTLNEMNSTRADYGEVIVKRVEKIVDGKKELVIEIPEWQNLEVDASDILNRPILETHYLTPSKLAEKVDIWENVKEVLKLHQKTPGELIKVKEINGEFPVAVYKQAKNEEVSDDDNFTFGRYRFYVAYVDTHKIYLYCDEQKENPYKSLAWKKRAKRPGVGVVEEGIPAQVWTNDVIQKEHKWFELASKAVLQSASRNLKGRNILSEVDNGVILEHDDGKPITTVSLLGAAVPEYQNLIDKWAKQYDRASNITDAARGENPPSGQAFRLAALVQQQTASSFDHRREDMGIFITELFNDWILPYLAKKMNKAHILASDYSAEELKSLDENYSNHNANQKAKEAILSGKIVTQEEYDGLKQGYKEFIAQTKTKRFLDIPKDYYKDFKPKITIVTTGEQKNKMAVLESMSNMLTLYASNPALFQTDPFASQALAFIMEKSGAGISPITMGLGQNKQMAQPMPGQPQPGQVQPEQGSSLPTTESLAPQAQQNVQA